MLKPLITICGTTGVGKSALAIDLALHLTQKCFGTEGWNGARIINADSMQVYRGLDIITNKVPVVEMKNVEHLLMGFKEPGEQYVVGDWVNDSLKLINELHQRNEIPIIVGGTSYWIQHLIFPNRLARPNELPHASTTVSRDWCDDMRNVVTSLPLHLKSLLEDLPDEPPSAQTDPDGAFNLHSLLTALDPIVGQRWHWRDTRKVLHNLTIIKNTRRRASEIIVEQSQSTASSRPRFRTLCFWLFAQPSYLQQRLDARVDRMIVQGLLDEIRNLRDIADLSTNPRVDVPAKYDYTLGIYQAIGYKEFHSYLNDPNDEAFKKAVEHMKLSTRQYAKKQISWIRNKLLPAIKEANVNEEVVPFYLLDATEVDGQWIKCVQEPAMEIMEKFLQFDDLPEAHALSSIATKMLTVGDKSINPVSVLLSRKKTICATCTVESNRPIMIEDGDEWQRHISTRVHKRLAAKAPRS